MNIVKATVWHGSGYVIHIESLIQQYDTDPRWVGTVDGLPDVKEYGDSFYDTLELCVDTIETYLEIVNERSQ